MGRRVFKYEIPVADEFVIYMPGGAEIIHVGVQGNTPCMWALVDPDAEAAPRKFYVHGTGHVITDRALHLGSFLLVGGSFVGHLFEPWPPEPENVEF